MSADSNFSIAQGKIAVQQQTAPIRILDFCRPGTLINLLQPLPQNVTVLSGDFAINSGINRGIIQTAPLGDTIVTVRFNTCFGCKAMIITRTITLAC